MNEKPGKVDIDFNEALRRIANVGVPEQLKNAKSTNNKTVLPTKDNTAKNKIKES